MLEAALAQVIPEPQDQGLVHRGDSLLGPVPARGAGLGQVHRDHRFPESRQHRHGLPRLIQGQAAAVKDELIVAPHLVHIDQGHPVFPGVGLEQPVAQLFFAHLEGRGGNIDEHRGALVGPGPGWGPGDRGA